jgi:hypothetical protein
MCIVDFYPMLTPDSGESCNMLIKLALSLWLISLVFAIKHTLIALRLQEWACIYIDTLNVPSRPYHRALIRLFSFLGVDLYNATSTTQMTFALIVSMCAFVGGAMVAFHAIDTRIAIAIDVAVTTVFVSHDSCSG